ncbi:MAG: hypothetical protein H0T96_07180 [Thermoleophilaceae bacterium]|nr:hypothetical protein [Thermoleophilaceae bacterium]MDQ3240272.1 hypothetical protein [Actinomycetota bacterium]MDQ3320297.1 hypothetical protein [Actinomycetota bacterium]MDQ3356481.1 hypothetical protein [Actinomycetota bacterium]
MPPESRPIPRYVAEPPQDGLPYGRFAQMLAERFVTACRELESEDEEIGEPGEIAWFPDRTYAGRTYIPAAATTSTGSEVFGYVSYRRAAGEGEPADYQAFADATAETAAANPDWTLDLSDHELEPWRGPEGRRGMVTLVWGRALVPNGTIATAELGPTTTDGCPLVEERFTLVSLDDYTGDLLEVRLYGGGGRELARESLYEGE